jgi:hypothetical protein
MLECENIAISVVSIVLFLISESMSITDKTKYNGILHAVLGNAPRDPSTEPLLPVYHQ